MIRTKLIFIIISALCVWLFVGILNKGYEYYQPQVCLKYPTLKMVFVKPDLADNETESLTALASKNVEEYNRVYQINERLGEASKLIAVILIQFFLTFLFVRFLKNYAVKVFVLDVVLFILSALVLFTMLELFSKEWVVIILSILLFNFLINYLCRNLLVSKFEPAQPRLSKTEY